MEGLAGDLMLGRKEACHETVPNSGGASPLRPTMLLHSSWINGVIKISSH